MTELMPWHKNLLVDPNYTRVDLVKEGANSQAHIKLFKSKGGTPMELSEILKGLKDEHRMALEAILKQKDQTITDLQDRVEKAAPASLAGQTEEEILKSVQDPAVKALLEKSIAKTKAAEAVAKALKEEKDNTEAIAKAKEVPNLGAEEAKLAEVYKKLKHVDSTLCEDVFGIFKAANALVKDGAVLSEIGKGIGNQEDAVVGGDEEAAWAKIETAAQGIAKAKNISVQKATSIAIEENPELYAQYLAAQRG